MKANKYRRDWERTNKRHQQQWRQKKGSELPSSFFHIVVECMSTKQQKKSSVHINLERRAHQWKNENNFFFASIAAVISKNKSFFYTVHRRSRASERTKKNEFRNFSISILFLEYTSSSSTSSNNLPARVGWGVWQKSLSENLLSILFTQKHNQLFRQLLLLMLPYRSYFVCVFDGKRE